MGNQVAYLSDTIPCNGCIHNDKCKVNKLACFAFARYVYTGEDNWTLPRLPSKKTYARIMFTHDSSLQSEIFKTLKEKELI